MFIIITVYSYSVFDHHHIMQQFILCTQRAYNVEISPTRRRRDASALGEHGVAVVCPLGTYLVSIFIQLTPFTNVKNLVISFAPTPAGLRQRNPIPLAFCSLWSHILHYAIRRLRPDCAERLSVIQNVTSNKNVTLASHESGRHGGPLRGLEP